MARSVGALEPRPVAGSIPVRGPQRCQPTSLPSPWLRFLLRCTCVCASPVPSLCERVVKFFCADLCKGNRTAAHCRHRRSYTRSSASFLARIKEDRSLFVRHRVLYMAPAGRLSWSSHARSRRSATLEALLEPEARHALFLLPPRGRPTPAAWPPPAPPRAGAARPLAACVRAHGERRRQPSLRGGRAGAHTRRGRAWLCGGRALFR